LRQVHLDVAHHVWQDICKKPDQLESLEHDTHVFNLLLLRENFILQSCCWIGSREPLGSTTTTSDEPVTCVCYLSLCSIMWFRQKSPGQRLRPAKRCPCSHCKTPHWPLLRCCCRR
jgi:hypothetical protein